MILNVEKFKFACKKILDAVDGEVVSTISDVLELKAEKNKLYLNVTNSEYFVTVSLDLEEEETFNAIVKAKLFLALISKITTSTVELTKVENSLVVKGNGVYKFALVGEDVLKELPKVKLNNILRHFTIKNEILQSILTHNSRELAQGLVALRPVQKLYYIDENGCITFTSGACVNDFTLPEPLKILLSQKVVKLFKLFNGVDVSFTLGYDLINNTIQMKVQFETDDVVITSVIPSNDSLLSSVPVKRIRELANKTFSYSVNVDKNILVGAIDRLLLFNNSPTFKDVGTFVFTPTNFELSDVSNTNKEIIDYAMTSESTKNINYKASIDLASLKTILTSHDDNFVTLSFGDNAVMVVTHSNIKNVIPQVRVNY